MLPPLAVDLLPHRPLWQACDSHQVLKMEAIFSPRQQEP